MKCIDCGKDAVLIYDSPQYLTFAFCKECVKKQYEFAEFEVVERVGGPLVLAADGPIHLHHIASVR